MDAGNIGGRSMAKRRSRESANTVIGLPAFRMLTPATLVGSNFKRTSKSCRPYNINGRELLGMLEDSDSAREWTVTEVQPEPVMPNLVSAAEDGQYQEGYRQYLQEISTDEHFNINTTETYKEWVAAEHWCPAISRVGSSG
jgi:hypothetical protein